MDSSPIFERSGIGAASILGNFGIKQVVDLPGVGKEYDDRAFLITLYIVDTNTVTTEAISSKHPELWGRKFKQLSGQCDTDGSGLMGGGKKLPSYIHHQMLTASQRRGWVIKCVLVKMNIGRNSADKPDKPSFWLGTFGGFPGAQSGLPPLKFTAIGCFLVYPASHRRIHITSDDINTHPAGEE
ncbi:hypothetical protein IW261DRAFT_1608889 [Armillaria novae-zelandiae]|uniref:Uncharacterized protein n=1 Tax=Armillaria novae-zelandiae TaxID=153914 RepID=A0AA39UCR1_9AGAR|nr:hypothetical protein IW261DRAFT_1608889 [Armillaria novae-zelandiae]